MHENENENKSRGIFGSRPCFLFSSPLRHRTILSSWHIHFTLFGLFPSVSGEEQHKAALWWHPLGMLLLILGIEELESFISINKVGTYWNQGAVDSSTCDVQVRSTLRP